MEKLMGPMINTGELAESLQVGWMAGCCGRWSRRLARGLGHGGRGRGSEGRATLLVLLLVLLVAKGAADAAPALHQPPHCAPPAPQVLGWQGSPYQFVISVFNLMLALQLGLAGALFYGTELGAQQQGRPELCCARPGWPRAWASQLGVVPALASRRWHGAGPWSSCCSAG
jgi:hypothetical protein